MRGYRIEGDREALARYMDRVYLACDLGGTLEHGDGRIDVWLRDASPPLPAARDVRVATRDAHDDDPDAWRRGDAAVDVHAELRIRPPWVAPASGYDGIELVVPRGMAFGSGEHDSTQAALVAMHAAPLRGGSLADVGTGSGILAAYARALGCAPVFACDVEEEAVAAARLLVPEATILRGDARRLTHLGRVDHVVANMTTDELIVSLPNVIRLWSRTGHLVLSGVRVAETQRLLDLLPTAPLHRVQRGDFQAFTWLGGPS